MSVVRFCSQVIFSVIVLTVFSGQSVLEATVTWVDWTTANLNTAIGTAGEITVEFQGNLNPVAQTSGGTYYWGVHSATYTSPAVVDNPPPDSDIIRLTGGGGTGIQTLMFSEPVVNPIMAILSLGRSAVPTIYDFDTPFDILHAGPGFFGDGPLTELAGDMLEGSEGHGLIQFQGTISSISWTMPVSEFWHGFQVAVSSAPSPLCDFNSDGVCNIVDLDSMLLEGPVAPGVSVTMGVNEQFDLTGDGMIDLSDRDHWLASAAAENRLGLPYKLGDANLDGRVDGSDFGIWNANNFTSTLRWSEGNFDGNAVVDGRDFGLWNTNKFTSSNVTVVPEPGSILLLMAGVLLFAKCSRR